MVTAPFPDQGVKERELDRNLRGYVSKAGKLVDASYAFNPEQLNNLQKQFYVDELKAELGGDDTDAERLENILRDLDAAPGSASD